MTGFGTRRSNFGSQKCDILRIVGVLGIIFQDNYSMSAVSHFCSIEMPRCDLVDF